MFEKMTEEQAIAKVLEDRDGAVKLRDSYFNLRQTLKEDIPDLGDAILNLSKAVEIYDCIITGSSRLGNDTKTNRMVGIFKKMRGGE